MLAARAPPLPRILTLAALAACLTTAAAWPLSYWRGVVVGGERHGVGLEQGAYYAGEALGSSQSPAVIVGRRDPGISVEWMMRRPTQRWKPVKVLDVPSLGTFIVVAAWVPPLVFAVPAYLGVRRWRRQARAVARGFEVGAAAHVRSASQLERGGRRDERSPSQGFRGGSLDLRAANAGKGLAWTNLHFRHTFGSLLAIKGRVSSRSRR